MSEQPTTDSGYDLPDPPEVPENVELPDQSDLPDLPEKLNLDLPQIDEIPIPEGGSLILDGMDVDGPVPVPNNPQMSGSSFDYAQSSRSSSWWHNWCSYFVQDNVTYGDVCIFSEVDKYGNIVPNLFSVHRYNPTKAGFMGQKILQISTYYTDNITYRDLTNPAFNNIAWISYPNNPQLVNEDTFFYALVGNNGGLEWYTLTQLKNAVASQNGYVDGRRVPAWDPAITVQTFPLLSAVNQQIYSTQSFF